MGVSSCACIILGIVEIQAVCLWACQPLICSQLGMCQNQTAVDVLQQTPSSSLTSTTGVRRTANSQSCLHMAASQTDRERLAHTVNVGPATRYGWKYWEVWSSHLKIDRLEQWILIYAAWVNHILKYFLKDHVTLKTGVMMLKIQLCHYRNYILNYNKI